MSAALSADALDQLFREARTYNGFLDKPVDESHLRAIWDLMKMGPTSANSLPARLVWCVSQEAKDRLADCASGNQTYQRRHLPRDRRTKRQRYERHEHHRHKARVTLQERR